MLNLKNLRPSGSDIIDITVATSFKRCIRAQGCRCFYSGGRKQETEIGHRLCTRRNPQTQTQIAVNFAATSDSDVGSANAGVYLCMRKCPTCWAKPVKGMDHWQIHRKHEDFTWHEDTDKDRACTHCKTSWSNRSMSLGSSPGHR